MSYDGTIEVGKLYVSRVGKPIRVYATDGRGMHPIHGAVKSDDGWRQQRWTRDGYDVSKSSKSSDDIVGLWTDPPQPKWRPFNEQELLKLVGRCVQRITDGKPDRWLVNRVRKDWVEIASWLAVSSAELLEKFELVGDDGETLYKCGVLEDRS